MLVAEPSSIHFDSIIPGKLYVIVISLINSSKTAQRIRVKPPITDYFALNYIPASVIAPGLDIRVEIECKLSLKENDNDQIRYSDVLLATMG